MSWESALFGVWTGAIYLVGTWQGRRAGYRSGHDDGFSDAVLVAVRARSFAWSSTLERFILIAERVRQKGDDSELVLSEWKRFFEQRFAKDGGSQ